MKEIMQSRREFLKKACVGALAVTATAALPALTHAEQEVPAYPYPYKPVEQEAVIRHSWDSYKMGCCSAVFGGVLGAMAEAYGYPYNTIPTAMFANGGGGYTVGSLCGTCGGAAAVFGLFCEPADARKLNGKLFSWYVKTEFPNFDSGYDLVKSVSGTVNCVDSLGNWLTASGLERGSAEQKARCGALSAEVAWKAVELLNIHFGYAEEPAEEPVAETAAANEYIGVGTSQIGGEVKVKVTMDGDKIAKIEVLSHNETAGISDPAFATIPQAIIDAQSTAVDSVTGATKTSEALIAAVNDALSQIKK